MKKSWIDLKEGLIIIPGHSQKRKKKDKLIPINSAIKPIIGQLLRDNNESEYLYFSIQKKAIDSPQFKIVGTGY